MDEYRLHSDAMAAIETLRVGSHGWVIPNGGKQATCGGPDHCRTCALELLLLRTVDRVAIFEGFKLSPGDSLLLVAPPDAPMDRITQVADDLKKRLPEVNITFVSGFTGIQVHQQERTV